MQQLQKLSEAIKVQAISFCMCIGFNLTLLSISFYTNAIYSILNFRHRNGFILKKEEKVNHG